MQSLYMTPVEYIGPRYDYPMQEPRILSLRSLVSPEVLSQGGPAVARHLYQRCLVARRFGYRLSTGSWCSYLATSLWMAWHRVCRVLSLHDYADLIPQDPCGRGNRALRRARALGYLFPDPETGIVG